MKRSRPWEGERGGTDSMRWRKERGDGVGGEVRAGGGLDCLLLGMGGG